MTIDDPTRIRALEIYENIIKILQILSLVF